MEQWFFRITDYAQALLDDLETVDWPESIKARQRSWIGRSEGAEIRFRVEEWTRTSPSSRRARTRSTARPSSFSRPNTSSSRGSTPTRCATTSAARRCEEDSGACAAIEKTGVFTGLHAVNPVNGEQMPDIRRRLRPDGLRHGRDHGRARARPARLRLRERVRVAGPAGRPSAGRRGRRERGLRRACRGRGARQLRRSSTACRRPRAAARSPRSWKRRAVAASPSTTGSATGGSRANATGGVPSRSSTATRAGSSPSPRTSSRSCCPRSRTTSRRACRRSRRPRTG